MKVSRGIFLMTIIWFTITEIQAQDNIIVHKLQPSSSIKLQPTTANNILVKERYNLLTFAMPFMSCPPCVNEINAIAAMLKSLGIKETQLVYSVVTSGFDLPSIASMYSVNYLSDNKWDFPVYVDTNFTLAKSLGYSSFPKTFLIDKMGLLKYSSDLTKDTLVQMRTEKLFKELIQVPRVSVNLLFLSTAEFEKIALMQNSPQQFQQYLLSKGLFKFSSFSDTYRSIIYEKGGYYVLVELRDNYIELGSSKTSDFLKYKQNFISAGYKILSNKKNDDNNFTLSNDKFELVFYNELPPKEEDYSYSPNFKITIRTLSK